MTAQAEPRNPGPKGGYRFMLWCHRVLPKKAFELASDAGAWVSLLLMPRQREHSRRYLARALGRPPRLLDLWRHFRAFSDILSFRLLCGGSIEPTITRQEGHVDEFLELATSGTPALYGTFHLGCSDLLGFILSRFGQELYMIRQRVGNSEDTERLSSVYGGVRILWINEPSDLLFGIKQALDGGGSLALQCDRHEHASKHEVFRFLGRQTLFPFTIYHLSALYRMPVAFCFAFREGERGMRLLSPPVFRPEGSRREILKAAHGHFQQVLDYVETELQRDPYQWFNFTRLVSPTSANNTAEPAPAHGCTSHG